MADSVAALARSVHDALSPSVAVTSRLEIAPSLHVRHASLAAHAGSDASRGVAAVLAASSGGRSWLVVVEWGHEVQGAALLLPAGCTAHHPSLYRYAAMLDVPCRLYYCLLVCWLHAHGSSQYACCTLACRYKDKGPESVVCLVETAGETASLFLVQVPTEGLSWVQLPQGPVDLVRVMEEGKAVQEVAAVEGVRSRCVCWEESWGTCALDVSGQRGLAAVLLRGEVVTLFDVQDEEEQEEEQEEEGMDT